MGGGSAVDIPIADTSSLGFKNIQEFADYILSQYSNQQTSIQNIINGTTTVGNASNLNGRNNYLINGDPGTMQSLELCFSTPFIDFHFDGNAVDYTSRIIERAQSQLCVEAPGGVYFTGAVDSPIYYQASTLGCIARISSDAPASRSMLWAY